MMASSRRLGEGLCRDEIRAGVVRRERRREHVAPLAPSVDDDKTQPRDILQGQIARAGRRAAAAAETEREGAADLPDASLRDGAAEAARALLSHAAAQHSSWGDRRPAPPSWTRSPRGCRERGWAGGDTRARGSRGSASRRGGSLRLERAVLAPRPQSYDPEMGGDFLYDTSWIEVATGHARVADDDGAGHEVAFGSGGGGPRGTQARRSRRRAAEEALRAAGRAAARGSSQLSALDACLEFSGTARVPYPR